MRYELLTAHDGFMRFRRERYKRCFPIYSHYQFILKGQIRKEQLLCQNLKWRTMGFNKHFASLTSHLVLHSSSIWRAKCVCFGLLFPPTFALYQFIKQTMKIVHHQWLLSRLNKILISYYRYQERLIFWTQQLDSNICEPGQYTD